MSHMFVYSMYKYKYNFRIEYIYVKYISNITSIDMAIIYILYRQIVQVDRYSKCFKA